MRLGQPFTVHTHGRPMQGYVERLVAVSGRLYGGIIRVPGHGSVFAAICRIPTGSCYLSGATTIYPTNERI